MKTFGILFLFLFSATNLLANDNLSSIKGKIIDASNGSSLPDAVVRIETLNRGVASDLNGIFIFEGLKPGNYELKISYVGYVTKKISLELEDNEIYKLDVMLEPEVTTTDTVLVEAQIKLNTDAGLLLQQKKSENISDAISSQQIKRTSDATGSEILKRVIGISVIQDKFVYVRGTSERYNNTQLNGAYLPSTEPDKKSFSFDIFPASLLENMIILKSNTPDQPGDFSGGLIKINTIDYPERFFYSFNINSSFTKGTTGNDFTSYKAGQNKFLFINTGFDDGGRQLPSIIPSGYISSENYSPNDIQLFGRSFRNNWNQIKTDAHLNGGFQISTGNNISLFNNPLGLIAAFSYKNSFENKTFQKTELNESSETNDTIAHYEGTLSEYSVMWGGIFNINYKIGNNHNLSLKNSITLTSEDNTEFSEGFYNPQLLDRKFYLTKFTERNLYSTQFSGEHFLNNFANLKVNWQFTYSESEREEPDFKRMMYQRDRGSEDPYYAPIPRGSSTGNETVGGRFFSSLSDITRGYSLDFEFPVKSIRLPFKLEEIFASSRLKFGGLLNSSERYYNARSFAPVLSISAPYSVIYQPIDSIFRTENISPDLISYYELTGANDTYTAKQKLSAAYVMVDILYKRIRFIAGARLENYTQELHSYNLTGQPVEISLNNFDILPSLNLTYQINENLNIRGAYSQSVSRPELREIAPTTYIDWSTFITTVGNPDSLRRTLVRNYDLRFEYYPSAGEILSASFFYKKFDSPIEEAFLPRSGDEKLKSFFNAKSGAENYGVEIEIRKKLGFISKILSDFSMMANLTLIKSQVDLTQINTTATEKTRSMQGQSPYMVNLGLFYENYILGTNINLLYNKIGDRISEVGLGGFADIYEKGRDIIDFVASQKLFKNFEIKLAVKDILNQPQIFEQEINGKNNIVREYDNGINYSFGVSFKY